MAKTPVPLDEKTIERCRQLILVTAQQYEIPAALITAHVRSAAADRARKNVYRVMILRLHLRRWQVARLFSRDVRRVRRSVIGV